MQSGFSSSGARGHGSFKILNLDLTVCFSYLFFLINMVPGKSGRICVRNISGAIPRATLRFHWRRGLRRRAFVFARGLFVQAWRVVGSLSGRCGKSVGWCVRTECGCALLLLKPCADSVHGPTDPRRTKPHFRRSALNTIHYRPFFTKNSENSENEKSDPISKGRRNKITKKRRPRKIGMVRNLSLIHI